MIDVVGVFTSKKDAARATHQLRALGVPEENISLLGPGSSEDIHDVPTTQTEGPGMGQAVGGVVGAAVGSSVGLTLGTAVASALIPGVGPVFGLGIAAAALFAGIMGGAAAGGKLEDLLAKGLPADELHLYADALRQGRSVVIVLATDATQADAARAVLEKAGAESLDAARESWWLGLRDAEAQSYEAGRDFAKDEPAFRRGFEAAQRASLRGKRWEEAEAILRSANPGEVFDDVFRRGYARGSAHVPGANRKAV